MNANLRTASIAAAIALVPAFFLGATTNAPPQAEPKPHFQAVFHKGSEDGGMVYAGCQQQLTTPAYTFRRNNFPSYATDTDGTWLPARSPWARFRGSKTTTVLTVNEMDAGTIEVGMVIQGTGYVSTCDDDNPYCTVVSFGTGDGGAGGTYNVTCSGTLNDRWLTGEMYGRWYYDGGTAAHHRVMHSQSFECHNGNIMIFFQPRKNGVDLKECLNQAFIVNANPVQEVTNFCYIHFDPGDYYDSAYTIDNINEHYDVFHSTLQIERID